MWVIMYINEYLVLKDVFSGQNTQNNILHKILFLLPSLCHKTENLFLEK